MCSVLCVLFQILVSPAPAGGNTNWFDPFFEVSKYKVFGNFTHSFIKWDSLKLYDKQACELLGCRIDYLGTHDYEGNVDHVMNRLEMLYQR